MQHAVDEAEADQRDRQGARVGGLLERSGDLPVEDRLPGDKPAADSDRRQAAVRSADAEGAGTIGESGRDGQDDCDSHDCDSRGRGKDDEDRGKARPHGQMMIATLANCAPKPVATGSKACWSRLAAALTWLASRGFGRRTSTAQPGALVRTIGSLSASSKSTK